MDSVEGGFHRLFKYGGGDRVFASVDEEVEILVLFIDSFYNIYNICNIIRRLLNMYNVQLVLLLCI